MDAICLLPDHIHCLFTMPEDESNYWDRLKMIKGIFTIEYLKAGGQDGVRSYSRMKKREAAIWQRRYWEHTIQDEDDYEKHFDYIHYHPALLYEASCAEEPCAGRRSASGGKTARRDL